MKKRMIAMILVISMIFALLPTYVAAVDSSPFKDKGVSTDNSGKASFNGLNLKGTTTRNIIKISKSKLKVGQWLKIFVAAKTSIYKTVIAAVKKVVCAASSGSSSGSGSGGGGGRAW